MTVKLIVDGVELGASSTVKVQIEDLSGPPLRYKFTDGEINFEEIKTPIGPGAGHNQIIPTMDLKTLFKFNERQVAGNEQTDSDLILIIAALVRMLGGAVYLTEAELIDTFDVLMKNSDRLTSYKTELGQLLLKLDED